MKVWRKLLCAVSFAAVSVALAVPVLADGAQWKRNDRGWWYEEANGTYPTNTWRLINGKWYYFDAVGYMAENHWIGNYYVGADGAMLASSWTPDGYYVDASGKWVEGRRHPVVESEPVKRASSGGSRSSGRSGGSGRRRGGSGSASGGGSDSGSTADTSVTASTQGQESDNLSSTAAEASQVASEETRVIVALRAQGLSEKEAKLYYEINAYRESLVQIIDDGCQNACGGFQRLSPGTSGGCKRHRRQFAQLVLARQLDASCLHRRSHVCVFHVE